MAGMRLLKIYSYRIQFHAKCFLRSVLNLRSFFIQVELNLSPDALKLIAKKALEKKTGARGLRAILVRTQCNCKKPNSLFLVRNEYHCRIMRGFKQCLSRWVVTIAAVIWGSRDA